MITITGFPFIIWAWAVTAASRDGPPVPPKLFPPELPINVLHMNEIAISTMVATIFSSYCRNVASLESVIGEKSTIIRRPEYNTCPAAPSAADA
ncbi:hypothetical protein GW17_00059945 [Ensete ventricosum]|nr:hypothetical protein GW17_00059945 [Ensete ventricosum]